MKCSPGCDCTSSVRDDRGGGVDAALQINPIDAYVLIDEMGIT